MVFLGMVYCLLRLPPRGPLLSNAESGGGDADTKVIDAVTPAEAASASR